MGIPAVPPGAKGDPRDGGGGGAIRAPARDGRWLASESLVGLASVSPRGAVAAPPYPSSELGLERGPLAARWRLAPICLGLAIAAVIPLVVVLRELLDDAANIFPMESEEAILAVLSLIDISLAANLVMIVMCSGYENFVSRFDLAENADWPKGMGTVDFSALKLKLVASIVARSGNTKAASSSMSRIGAPSSIRPSSPPA